MVVVKRCPRARDVGSVDAAACVEKMLQRRIIADTLSAIERGRA